MKQTCLLADTGLNKSALLVIVVFLIILASILFYVGLRNGGRFRYTAGFLLIPTIVFGTLVIATSSVYALEDCTEDSLVNQVVVEDQEAEPRVWTPEGRFQSLVFDSEDVITQENVNFGTRTNFAGGPQAQLMTINQPDQSVDSEKSRPLIVAFPGGDVMGFCDQTDDVEQQAMLELARYGYVTATVTQFVDPAFCDGEPTQSYHTNYLINLSVVNAAIQYLYDNAATYEIDQNRTALYGYSIGGQIALLKLREDHKGAPNVKVLAGLSSVTNIPTFDDAFSAIAGPQPNSPSILMISYEPDSGYGPGIDPDARGDCEELVLLGHDCTFAGLTGPDHPVHANTTALITPENIAVDQYFRTYMYNNLVL